MTELMTRDPAGQPHWIYIEWWMKGGEVFTATPRVSSV
jgi:hypothetical protein